LLETKIIKISNADNKSFGLNFNFNDGTTNIGLGNQVSNQTVRSSQSGGFYKYYSNYITVTMDALEKNNQATTIARPILLASNNRPARIFIGTTQIVATGISGEIISTLNADTGVTTTTDNRTLDTEEKEIGTSLAIQPSINIDGSVTLDIFQSNTSIITDGMNFPFLPDGGNPSSTPLDAVEDSNVRTVAIAKDGYTIALGGNITTNQTDNSTKVPVLGDLPILGKLFKTTDIVDEKSQYIMLITPHIILSPHQGTAVSNKIAEIKQQISPNSQPVRSKKDSYLYLNHFAAKAMRNQRPNDNSVTSATLPKNSQKLFNNPNINSIAVASYQQKNLYINVLELSNNSNTSQPIDLQQLRGSWLSAAREQPFLAAKDTKSGQMRDSSYLYLISNTPFGQAVGNYLK
jgi:general secretion pathway protein D